MPETDKWLNDYGEKHIDIDNPHIYWLAVPLLVLATVGMLWSLPVPAEFSKISPILNWGSAFLMVAVVYYFIISISLAIGMLPFIFGICGIQIWLSLSALPTAKFSSALFVTSIVGLFLGRYAKSGIQAVFEDIQMMMIAPLWILANLYRRLGIPF